MPVLYLGLCCSPVCASTVYDCVVQVLLSSHTQAFVSQVKKVLSLGSINLCVKVNIETDLLANVEWVTSGILKKKQWHWQWDCTARVGWDKWPSLHWPCRSPFRKQFVRLSKTFFSRVRFLSWLLLQYLFHRHCYRSSTWKIPSFCQKHRWQVTAKHAYTLRMWLCMNWHGAWLCGVHRTLQDGSSSCGTNMSALLTLSSLFCIWHYFPLFLCSYMHNSPFIPGFS